MTIFAFMFKVVPIPSSDSYGIAASGYACIYVCDDDPKSAVDKAVQCVKGAGYKILSAEKSGEAELTPSTPPEQRILMKKAEQDGMSSCFVMGRENPSFN